MRTIPAIGCAAILLVSALAATACRPAQPAPLLPGQPKPAHSQASPTALEALPAATSAPPAAETAPPPASPPAAGAPAPDRDEREPFRSGLINGAQGALDEQPGASVYRLDLRIDDSLTRVTGRQEVRYTNTEDVALDEIAFRLFPNLTGGSMAVSNVSVDGEPAAPRYAQSDSAMFVPFSETLQPGEQAVIGMDFDVTIPTDAATSPSVCNDSGRSSKMCWRWPMPTRWLPSTTTKAGIRRARRPKGMWSTPTPAITWRASLRRPI